MTEPEFLDVEDVLAIHAALLEEHGGQAGVRDRGLLESAVATPQVTFGGELLHEDLFAMAAAYAFHIAENQPFLDGNKRIGFVTAVLFLELNGYRFNASEVDATVQTLALAARKLGEDGYAIWLKANSTKR